MASGWGEEDGTTFWFANRDFNFRNLTVAKGEKLPNAWQRIENAKYLKEHYGEDCIVRAASSPLLSKSAKAAKAEQDEWVPSRKGTKEAVAKGK